MDYNNINAFYVFCTSIYAIELQRVEHELRINDLYRNCKIDFFNFISYL